MRPPYLPFPLPMRIGTDICSISRIRKILGKDHAAFTRRLLTKNEIAVHQKRLAIPLLSNPITRYSGKIPSSWTPDFPLPAPELLADIESQPLSGDLFDGEGNYILHVSEWQEIHKRASVTWAALARGGSSRPTNLEKALVEIEGHATMSDYELATSFIKLRMAKAAESRESDEDVEQLPVEELRNPSSGAIKQMSRPNDGLVYDGPAIYAERHLPTSELFWQHGNGKTLSTEEKMQRKARNEPEFDESKQRERQLQEIKNELDRVAKTIREGREIKRLRAEEFRIKSVAQFLAGRWAAKEAIIKAHNHRRVTFHEIEILPLAEEDQRSVAPVALVKSEEGDEHPYREVQVSISHDGSYSTATALVCEPSPVK